MPDPTHVRCPGCNSVLSVDLDVVTLTKPTPAGRQLDLGEQRPRVVAERPRWVLAAEESAAAAGFTLDELRERNRTGVVTAARREAMAAAREAGATLHEIAGLFDRDHSTVYQSIAAHERRAAA